MRERLSELLVETCAADERYLVLSGDHGYALFDALRTRVPNAFVNVGVMEQAMIGIAAGLAKSGLRPIVYGLAAFVPIRVLEQIKLDLCHSSQPVIMLGDGAGLVYSTLGASHQCGEDLAALRPMPGIKIFTPADAIELEACFKEALAHSGPSYIRIGKSDRPVLAEKKSSLSSTAPRLICQVKQQEALHRPLLITMGSMNAIGFEVARSEGLDQMGILRVKPIHPEVIERVAKSSRVLVIEEHSRYGGLASAVSDAVLDAGLAMPKMTVWSLKDQFVHSCGSYQHALSEHQLSDLQLRESVAHWVRSERGI